jgi:hypothetical protein
MRAADSPALEPTLKPLIITLLTRMSTSRTDKYCSLLALFWLHTMAVEVAGLTPDLVIRAHDSVQPGCVPPRDAVRRADRRAGCGRRCS